MDYETEITKEDIEKNKGIAALSYLLFFLPLIFAQDSKFARFHMNQGLILLLVAVIFNVFFNFFPFLGIFVAPVIGLATIILTVLGIKAALAGEVKELPIIGTIRIIQ